MVWSRPGLTVERRPRRGANETLCCAATGAGDRSGRPPEEPGESGQSKWRSRARPVTPSLEADTHSVALRKVTETLAAHSTQIDKVLQAVLDTRTSLEGKIDVVMAEVNILCMEHRKLTNRVTTAESTLETAQPDIEDMKARIQHQESEILRQHRRVDEAQGPSRRNNVRFLD
ncbi:hypothetical protein NDU88_004519 [Pleurodeles waltl]|uniref:Uncharacterized protein n=1 Tax=Pleurodeles waltl TaxID=8319 RepID=A0AAV7V1Z6_PLEWA|nr:hypothetical protein NDU88_004519 [Pleurodeles waltl]